MSLQCIQPEGLWDSSPYLFSQVVKASSPRGIAFIAGQVAIDPNGSLVGVGDVDAQLRQIFSNLRAAVEAAGGSVSHIASLTVYVKDIGYHRNYLKVLADEFAGHRPAETLVQVAALGLPELEAEIQAVAIL